MMMRDGFEDVEFRSKDGRWDFELVESCVARV